jgi:Septum formation
VAEAWTCSRCSTVNEPSYVVCHECGQVRPDLDRAAMAGESPPQAPADSPPPAKAIPDVAPPAQATTSADSDPAAAAAIAAGSIPGWTPPAEWTRPAEGGASPAGPSEGWAASQGAASEGAALQGAASQGVGTSGGTTPQGAPAWGGQWASPESLQPPPPAPPTDPAAIPGWSGAEAPRRSWFQRIPAGWLVVAVLVVGGALVGWYVNAGRSSSGDITKAGDLNATDLRVGDCFDLKDPNVDTIDDVRALPCTTEHTYELFFRGTMPDGDYPTDDAFDAWMSANCVPAFGTYVGRAYGQSTLEVYYLVPSDDAWRSGDRSIQCAVYPSNNAHPTTSLKGSQQ